MTSLPRDAYIDLKSVEAKDKLTHTGLFGIEETRGRGGGSVGHRHQLLWKGQLYYGDKAGGRHPAASTWCPIIRFDTHGMGGLLHLLRGENHLDGSRALAFARGSGNRFSDGDLQRNRNQQLVLEGILKKTLSSTTILTKYASILQRRRGQRGSEPVARGDIQRLVKMQLDTMPSWTIERQSIIGTPDADVCYSEGNQVRSIVLLDQESMIQALDQIVEVMEDDGSGGE